MHPAHAPVISTLEVSMPDLIVLCMHACVRAWSSAGLSGSSRDQRPFYDIYGTSCIKVTCRLPVVQRDHPLAKAGMVPDFNSTCLSSTLRVVI